jgi:CheY-like chemotaxis protein
MTRDQTQSSPGAGREGGRRTVLVVDDETDILESITALLEAVEANPRVITARDGKEALEILEHEDVDLIVTDYRMPRMDGLELMTNVRKTDPRMPLILITAYPDPGLEDTAKHTLGVSRFIRKPFEPSEIIMAVEEGLKQP